MESNLSCAFKISVCVSFQRWTYVLFIVIRRHLKVGQISWTVQWIHQKWVIEWLLYPTIIHYFLSYYRILVLLIFLPLQLYLQLQIIFIIQRPLAVCYFPFLASLCFWLEVDKGKLWQFCLCGFCCGNGCHGLLLFLSCTCLRFDYIAVCTL